MVFRNLTLFRFPASAAEHWFDDRPVDDGLSFSIEPPSALPYLEECRLKPVGPRELSSRGFIPPHGGDSDALMHRSGGAVWLTVGGEDRILPGAVVNDMLAKKLAEIEKTEGRKPGGRTRKRIKDELIVDLLPRAFVKPSRVDAIIDLAHGIIAVDTSSRRLGENVVSEVRRALGSFPALPLNAEVAPRSVLTDWVAGEPLPDGLTIGDECELRDPFDHGAVVKCSRQDLQGDEVGKHLEAGKQVTRLELTLNDHVSFVIGEDLVVRKFRLLDGATDALENIDRDDLRAELNARFALMSGELHALFSTIERAFRVSKAEG
ncbi:MAG: recombination-associated protein RdgC [Lysobacter sp.]